jgi:hypothetical protein
LADVDDIFGWMVGSWDVDAVIHDAGGRTQKTKGEVHASWVLEGRALQDLFIFPRRADRVSGVARHGDRYGTTLKTYDRKSGEWRVTFINPASDDTSAQLLARRSGDGVDMEGSLSDGTPVRWQYRSITPNSFRYTAERLEKDSKSWRLYLELFGTRSGTQTRAAGG